MQDWVNIVAMATGLAAIWYTIRESRQNNKVLLKIRKYEASGHQSVNENNCQPFRVLKILIENRGIPLHSIQAAFSFSHPQHPGRYTFPLKRRKLSGDRDEFAKGMVVEFGFKSYELDQGDRGFLKILEDSSCWDATLCIYSQDYLAKEFRINGVIDNLKSRWNRFAYRFNNLFTRDITRGEHKLTYTPNIIATRPLLFHSIRDVCQWIRDEENLLSQTPGVTAVSPSSASLNSDQPLQS
ncbi:MAG: hypothetical protein L0228_21770 [Planctomycetes bacterium]|nr:hypothetical protein [Planctomycetota bacterium]